MNKDNNYKRDLLQIQHKLNILDQKCITLSWQNAAMSQIMVDKQLCTNEELNAYITCKEILETERRCEAFFNASLFLSGMRCESDRQGRRSAGDLFFLRRQSGTQGIYGKRCISRKRHSFSDLSGRCQGKTEEMGPDKGQSEG